MRRTYFLAFMLFVASAAVLVAACSKKESKQETASKGLPASGGKTLEVVLVVPDEVYKGELKDTIGTYFMKACEGLSQPEPLFDVVQMNPQGFFKSDMLQKHRNVIIIDMKPGNPNKLRQAIDYRSYPQAWFELSVDNRDSLFALIARYQGLIREKFHDNEHKRVHAAFQKLENTDITRSLKKKFGFWLTVSEEFYMATDESEFVWLRKEPKDGSLDIMIRTVPYIGEAMLEQEKILDLRDSTAKQYIPGPSKGSYMGTERRFPCERRIVKIGDLEAVETRGLWRLFNDWMGGPFVNYCFVDKAGSRFVMIDCFLYSPRHPKRDQLMQLESIVYGIKFNK